MLKMITYSAAKTILGVTGTAYSNNRDVWRKWVEDNGGDPTMFTSSSSLFYNWALNRLVPAEAVLNNRVTIIWKPNGGTWNNSGGSSNISDNVTYNSLIVPPDTLTKTGYTFSKWVNDDSGNDYSASDRALANTSYTAQWNVDSYTIVWWNEGRASKYTSDTTAQYGATISSPGTPTKTNYTFAGWRNRLTNQYLNSGVDTAGPSLIYSSTGKIEYEAVFTQNTQYTMTWNPNGGIWADSTGTGNKTTYEYAGNTITVPSVNITKDGGWAFDGWYNSTLNRDYQVGDTAGGNYTFTAKWTPAIQLLATVSWLTDNDGGSGAASLVHGSPDNNIENGDTTSDWLSATTPIVPINIRFEPLFTLNGQEIGPINDSFTTSLYTTKGVSMPYQLDEASTIIGYYGGTGFKISDLTWDATTTGTGYVTDQLYNNGQPYTYDIDLIFRNVNGGGPTNGNVSVTACNMNTNSDGPQSGYGMAITIHTDSSDPNGNNVYMYWMDEIPVTYVAKYQGNVVTTMTIKMAAYSWAALRDTYGPDASEPNPGTHPRIDGPWKVHA